MTPEPRTAARTKSVPPPHHQWVEVTDPDGSSSVWGLRLFLTFARLNVFPAGCRIRRPLQESPTPIASFMSHHESLPSDEVIYCLCSTCGDTFGSVTADACTCPRCQSMAQPGPTPPPQAPPIIAKRPKPGLIAGMPMLLKAAIVGAAILLATLFVVVITQREAARPPRETTLTESQMQEMNAKARVVIAMIMVVPALLVYLLPSLIAVCARHRNAAAVVATNLVLGWTGLGWCVALIWALMSTQHGQPRAPVVST